MNAKLPSHFKSLTARGQALLRLALWAAVLAALAAVFAAYLSPQLVFDLASRAWACF